MHIILTRRKAARHESPDWVEEYASPERDAPMVGTPVDDLTP